MVGTIKLTLSSTHSYHHCYMKNQHQVLWLSDLAAVEAQLAESTHQPHFFRQAQHDMGI